MASSTSLSETSIALICYCFAANTMTLTNKFLLSVFRFRAMFLALAVQSVVTVSLLVIFARAKLIKFKHLNRRDALRWLPIATSLILMLYTGAQATHLLPITLFNIFKTATLILQALGERFLLNGSRVTRPVQLSLFLVTWGSVISGWNSVSVLFDANSAVTSAQYFEGCLAASWMASNCFSAASYSLLLRHSLSKSGFTEFDTMFFNHATAIPLLISVSYLMEHDEIAAAYSRYSVPANRSELGCLAATVLAAGVLQFTLSFCISWALRITSSTTLGIVGSLNKIPMCLLAIVLFQETMSPSDFQGMSFTIAGACVYCLSRARQAAEAAMALPHAGAFQGGNKTCN
ncbi:hypothetical protein BJ741DRAFT_590521 [Chytriomyces cf. hyalinus JEL632]|nr:hypothetical protein BJ741DRAFT_590521 [Chytriomyces cf. hyalinus JEL632]